MNTKPGEKNLSASKVRENAMTFLEEFRKHVKARDYDAETIQTLLDLHRAAGKRAVQALAGRSFGTNPDRLELEDLPASGPLCVRCADQEPGSPPLPTECTCGKTVTSDTIAAELRNARMLVNYGHGDVRDEPDPLHEAAADEIERLDRELEALEKTNEHLRAALKRIVDLRHLSSTREMAEIAAFALRTPLRSLPMSEKVRP
jgi:hypothetical protein